MSPSRDLRLLAGAVFLSSAGDLLALLAIVLRVHDTTGSGFAVAALFAAHMLPIVVLAPLAGRLADRVETVHLLGIVALLQAGVATVLVFSDGLPAFIALTTLLGCGAAIAQPAEAALVPVVANEGELTRANGWMEAARYGGYTAGPLLAGVLALQPALAGNALSFLAVAAAAAMLKARRNPDSHSPLATGHSGGLSILLHDRTLKTVIGAAVASLALISASMTIEVFYVKDVVGAGNFGYALTIAAWTIGMVAGALRLAERAGKRGVAVAALGALVLQGAGMALSASWAILPVAAGGYVVGGIGHGVKNVLLRTLIQERVAGAAHGRAFAAYNAARNTAELGALGLGGLLVSVLGAQLALALAGMGPVIFGVAGLVLLKRSRAAAYGQPGVPSSAALGSRP
jgi:MFS family permease